MFDMLVTLANQTSISCFLADVAISISETLAQAGSHYRMILEKKINRSQLKFIEKVNKFLLLHIKIFFVEMLHLFFESRFV